MARLYFFLMTILMLFILFMLVYHIPDEGMSILSVYGWMRLIVALFALIGLYGFVYKKALLARRFWLVVFFVVVLDHIYGHYILFLGKPNIAFVFVVFVNSIYLIIYYALLRYYRSFDLIASRDGVSGSRCDKIIFGIGSSIYFWFAFVIVNNLLK